MIFGVSLGEYVGHCVQRFQSSTSDMSGKHRRCLTGRRVLANTEFSWLPSGYRHFFLLSQLSPLCWLCILVEGDFFLDLRFRLGLGFPKSLASFPGWVLKLSWLIVGISRWSAGVGSVKPLLIGVGPDSVLELVCPWPQFWAPNLNPCLGHWRLK